MKRTIHPVRKMGGTIRLPGDKSVAHRAVLFSLLSKKPITVHNVPRGADCLASLEAVKSLGVQVEFTGDRLQLTPPESLSAADNLVIDCHNSGTTARLLCGIIAGSNLEVTLTGDDSLKSRPMKRIIDPLTQMGAECYAEDGHLPLRIRGRRLQPFTYELPVASAQVKSALLLAGVAASQSVTVREKSVTRDHTEIMARELGCGIIVREIKAVLVPDPQDPRKKRLEMPEAFKKEIAIPAGATVTGGTIDIPGDISTGAFFLAAAAMLRRSLTIENLGLNPTRTSFLDHLRNIGCKVAVTDKRSVSGELRGTVTVTGETLKARKISGEAVVGLIDEIPMVSVLAAFADGTTVIRDAGELRHKESDRLAAIHSNLQRIGVRCGLLEDGLVIDGGGELSGADFESFGDHRIAMAFSIAALGLTGPSTIDDDSVVGVSCPEFYELLDTVTS